MSFLGLVGVPATPVTYPAYQALKALSPALGAAFAAAEGAAIAALAAKGAAVIGAGALGWMIGTAIREQLLPGEPPLALSTWATGGTPGQTLFVQFTFYSPPNAPINSEVPVTGNFAGVLRESIGADSDRFYIRQIAPPLNVQMVQFAPSFNPDARIEITGFRNPDGTPNTTPRKVPVLPQTTPYVPVRVPVTIPAFPGSPAFPITPVVVPTPGNDPDEDDKLREPGITVQIPELGLQIQYTPTGVRVGRFSSPETRPYDPPKIGVPPGTPPPASDPCECDEGESKDDEIICRIKTLQDEILDDGYTTEQFNGGPSNFIERSGLPDEFYLLKVGVASKPKNVATQSYEGGAPTVYYTGWVSWKFDDRQSERIRLEFDVMEFKPPPGCTGFVLASNRYCTHTTQAFTRKKKDYIDVCDGFVLN